MEAPHPAVPRFGEDSPEHPQVVGATVAGGGPRVVSSSGDGSAAGTPVPRLSDAALAARVAAVPAEALAAVKSGALAAAPDIFTPTDLADAADADAAADAGTAPADPSAAGGALLSLANLNRFLRAAGGDVPGAIDRLVKTARWRARRPPGGPCPLCVQAPGSHYMQIVGRDAFARPIIYSALALARDRSDVSSNVAHMTSVFETAAALMMAAPALDGPSGPLAEQWTWVSDFTGFGLRDCDPRIGRAFLSLAADHYPERLSRFVLVGTPPIFNSLWRLLSRHVCEDTRKKILFLEYDPAPGGALERGLASCDIGPDLTAWLLREMSQNRDPAVLASGKAYPYGSVLEPAGKTAATWQVDGHDVRGVPGVLEVLAACPRAPVVNGGGSA